MIVKNEEATLARCLNCVKKFADEIVIADTGSEDGTLNIARSFTPFVYRYEWNDDFAAARNFSFEKATGDLVMWIDADDVVTDENCERINELKTRQFDAAFLKYAAAFEGDTPTFVYYRERIFRRSLNPKWIGEVHEVVTPCGEIVYSDAEIHHRKVKDNAPLRNLNIYQKLIARGISLDERQKFYYGRELFFNGMYRESIAVLTDFLNGGGWIENKIEACRTIYKAYAVLGEESAAVNSLLFAFALSFPRAEDCCILGAHFMQKDDLKSAVFWYETALKTEEDEKSGAFLNIDCKTFIPYIQLCVLYDRLGDVEKAYRYNELAGQIKPHDKSYLFNKNYFKNKFNKEI